MNETKTVALPRPAARRRAAYFTSARLRQINAVLGLAILLFAVGVAGRQIWRGVVAPVSTAPAAIFAPMTVQPGESLWSLAQRYGDPNAYILDRVDVLARTNRLPKDAVLIPGQQVVVPVANPAERSRLQREVASGAFVQQ